MAARARALDTKLRILVAAVTAAERKEPMPSTSELVAEIGCVRHAVPMAVNDLEKRGILRRLHGAGDRMRLMICATGAATAEAERE